MKKIFLTATVSFAASGALAYEPAVEKEFSEIAEQGCSNRGGDFMIRGMVSSADEDTVVLSDPTNPRSTVSVTLPGRGPWARTKGVFTKSKHETSDERLNELSTTRTLVMVTAKCKGNGTPIARNISYENADGTRGSITF